MRRLVARSGRLRRALRRPAFAAPAPQWPQSGGALSQRVGAMSAVPFAV